MMRQQDFDDQAMQARDRALRERQVRVKVAAQQDDENWALPAALIGALAVALMLSAFF